MKKKKSVVSIFLLLFFIAGIALLIAGIIVLCSGIRFRKDAVEVSAVITDIETYSSGDDTHHTVWVEYEHDGKTYDNVRLNEYNSGMYTGKEITVLINPKDPRKVSTKFGTVFAGGILILMGVIFTVVGIIPIVMGIRRSFLQRQLLTEGRLLIAKVESIAENPAITVNGSHPYVVCCTFLEEYKGVTYRFKSGNVWENPAYALQPGSEINVYVNANDFSEYFVDVESAMEGRVVDFT